MQRHSRGVTTMKRPAEFLATRDWGRFDPALVSITVALVSLGLVMVYSASVAVALQQGHSETYYFLRQLAFVALGFVAMIACSRFPYHRLARAGKPLYGVSVASLVVVLLYGRHIGGASRWLPTGPLQL